MCNISLRNQKKNLFYFSILHLLWSGAKLPPQSLLNLLRNDQGRSKNVINPPLASSVLHFVGIQTLSNTLRNASLE
jgi:hypothetical protein